MTLRRATEDQPQKLRYRRVGVRNLTPELREKIERDLTFPYEVQISRTRTVTRKYRAYKKIRPTEYHVPRGYEEYLGDVELYRDATVAPPMERPVQALTELRDHQEPVKDIFSRYDSGIICAPTGVGKTVMACVELIAKSGLKTIVINRTRDLSEQWRSRILDHTTAQKDQIGWIGSGNWREADITVATWQTLSRRLEQMEKEGQEEYHRFVRAFGLLIVDEAHGVAAKKVKQVVERFWARHLWGLTATPYRSDEFSQLIAYTLGPVRVEIERPEDSVPIYFTQVDVPNTEYPGAFDWQKLATRISNDDERTRWIANHMVWEGNVPTPALIICVRKKILNDLMLELQGLGEPTSKMVSITSDTPRKKREEILQKGYEGKYDYILSTTLANEGLDWPPLKSICLVFPGRYEGTVIQQTGRVSRPYPGKTKAFVFDYVDQHGITLSQAKNRFYTYLDQGYKLMKGGT